MNHITGWKLVLNSLAPHKVHLIGWCTHSKMFAIMFEDGSVARTHMKYLEMDYD